MEILYKLTDEDDCTYNGCQWGEGITHTVSGKGELCGPGWIHVYSHPLLAVLLNPIHGNFDLKTAHLWEGEGEVGKTDYGLKEGCTEYTTIRRIPVPEVTLTQRVRFALLAALAAYAEPSWVAWAKGWLDGTDCSETTARAARAARAAGGQFDLITIAKQAVEG